MGIIMRNNIAYSGGSSNETVELTLAEYERREAAGAIDSDTIYFINDATDSYNAGKIVYDNTESGMTAGTVQGAIDELNSNIGNWIYLGTYALNREIILPTSWNELFLYAHSSDDTTDGFSFNIPNIFASANSGKTVRQGSYNNTGWYFDISVKINSLNSIMLASFTRCGKSETNAKMIVYYK